MAKPDRLGGHPPPPSQDSRLYVVVWAIFNWAFFCLLVLPNIALAGYRKLFPLKGKCLDGKVVLVTGAARGFGRELALAFAHLGCKVACVDLDETNVLETAADIVRDGERAKAYVTNVAKVEEVRALHTAVTADLGPVDILLNNAGLIYNQRLAGTPDDHVRAVVSVNLLGYIWMVREFLPAMKKRGSGHIVAISSMSAVSCGLPNASLYVSSKYAIDGFMKSLRLEVIGEGFQNIHFTTVYPTFMTTSDLSNTILKSKLQGWCRQPAEVAARTVLAVRRNIVELYVPEHLFYLAMLTRLLPTKMADMATQFAVGGGLVVLQEQLDRLEPVIKDTIKSK